MERTFKSNTFSPVPQFGPMGWSEEPLKSCVAVCPSIEVSVVIAMPLHGPYTVMFSYMPKTEVLSNYSMAPLLQSRSSFASPFKEPLP